ncbi:porin family protein [Shewanella gaetbuli]
MNFNLKALPIAISIALLPSAVLADESTEAKVAKLEQQVQSLQAQQTKSLADKFNFNGFISGAYISADNNAGYNGATTSADFSQDSKIGFQGTFNISNNTQAVLQLMMKGENDWDVEAEWAYLSHRFDNGIKIRGGKLRVPLFMYSDYLDVGYAQPFARPPGEVYDQVPFSSYTGVDLAYDFEFDDSTLTVQAFGGESDVEVESDTSSDTNLDLSNLMGINASWTDLTWTVRAVYGETVLDGTASGLGIDDEKATFNGLGGSYDNGSFLAVAEWTTVDIEGLLADTESAYLTLGYRISSFTPYVTAAYVKTTDNDVRGAIPLPELAAQLSAALNEERTAYSVGLRWDAIDNVALKFDVTYLTDFGDTTGGTSPNLLPLLMTGENMYDDSMVYTVKFDAVF